MADPHPANPELPPVPETQAGAEGRRRVSRPMSAQRYRPSMAVAAEGGTPAPAVPTVSPPELAAAGERNDYPPDLVFIVDHSGQVLYVNRALGALTEEDVIGSEITDWIFPEQHAVVLECLDRVREHGRAEGCEIPGIQHYDADAWYECRITPNHRNGAIVSVTIIARDITRHKRAQQRMRTRLVEVERMLEDREADLRHVREAAEASAGAGAEDDAARADRWFRTLLDEAGEAIFISDAGTGTLLDLNETASRWLREPRDELVGRRVVDLEVEFPILPPDDADLQFTETRDTRRPLILNGGVHRRRDGSAFPVEVAVARHALGEQELVLTVVRDVKGRQHIEDALHEREARYWALFDQTHDAVYITTRAGVVEEGNPAALALFGYPPDEFTGLDARELIPEPDDIRRWQKAMGAGGVVDRLEIGFRRRDGASFPGRLSASRLRDRDGQIRGYQCVVRPDPSAADTPAVPAAAAPEAPVVVRPPASAAPARPTVLVVEPDVNRRDEMVNVLEGAGYLVETAPDPARAAERVRAPGGIMAAVVGLDGTGATGEWALRSIRALDDAIPLIAVVAGGDPAAAAARMDDVDLAATLPAPVHPLALVQALRSTPPQVG